MNVNVVGLDMSLTSPAACVKLPDGSCKLACFAQRQTDFAVDSGQPGIQITVLPRIPSSATSSDMQRYKHIVTYLTKFMFDNECASSTRVLVEGYAFPVASMAGSTYKLHELTGIMKYEILRNFGIAAETVGVGTWKKLSVGNGHATKHDVVRRVRALTGVDMMTTFGKSLQDGPHAIPCPIQDLCDAYCIAFSADVVVAPPRTDSRKKRKRNEKD